jgi:DNA-directed RNA polymerase subunit RPC12/RpoP
MEYVCSKCGGAFSNQVGYDVEADDNWFQEMDQYLCEDCGNIDCVGIMIKDGNLTEFDDRKHVKNSKSE